MYVLCARLRALSEHVVKIIVLGNESKAPEHPRDEMTRSRITASLVQRSRPGSNEALLSRQFFKMRALETVAAVLWHYIIVNVNISNDKAGQGETAKHKIFAILSRKLSLLSYNFHPFASSTKRLHQSWFTFLCTEFRCIFINGQRAYRHLIESRGQSAQYRVTARSYFMHVTDPGKC